MKWLKNLESFGKSRTLGVCPYCGSKRLQSCFAMVNEREGMGYGDMWCEDCKKGYHMSRVSLQEDFRIVGTNGVAPPPRDIQFDN